MSKITSRHTVAQKNAANALLAIFLIASTAFSTQVVATSNSLSATEQQLINNLKVETIRDVVTTLSADDMAVTLNAAA